MALPPAVQFLGHSIMRPVIIEVETDEAHRDTLSGKRVASGGSLHRVRLAFRLINAIGGDASIRLAAHKAQFGLGRSFPCPMPQRYGFVAPGGAVNTRNGSTYALNQTSIQVTTGGGVVIQGGSFFTMPGDPKLYEVAQGRTGSGAILIKPGLRMAYTGSAAALDFSPTGTFYHDSGSLDQFDTQAYSAAVQLVEAL